MRINIIAVIIACFTGLIFADDLHSDADIGKWWLFLEEDSVNYLITEAFRNNPDISSLYASLSTLKADLKATNAATSIQSGINGAQGYSSQESDNELLSDDSSFYRLSVSASKTLDLFSRQKALIRQAEIMYSAGEDDILSLKTFVSKEIVLSWLRLKEAAISKNIKTKILKLHETAYSLLSERQKRGLLNGSQLLDKRIILERLRREINLFNQTETMEKTLLITLCGIDKIPQEQFVKFNLPHTMEFNKDIDTIVKTHPDLISVIKRIDAVRESIKYYKKSYYPDFSVKSSINYSSDELSSLLDEWQAEISVNISQLISDGGKSDTLKEKAYASLEKYNAEYKSSYYKIFKNLTDALSGEKIKRDNLSSIESNGKNLSMILNDKKLRFHNGTETMITVINSEISWLENELSKESLIKQIIVERVGFYTSAVGS